MMKKTGLLMTVLAGLMFLSACNKDYTLDDAKKYSRTRLGVYWPELIGEEENGEDTVWTFRERNPRGLQFHIVEDHYITGIDSSSWEASRMYSDYDGIVVEHYIGDYQNLHADKVIHGADDQGICQIPELKYEFHNRRELAEAVKDAGAFLKYIQKKNGRFYSSKKTYEIHADFTFDGGWHFRETWNMISGAGDPEMKFLAFVLAHYDEEQMSYYTSREIQQCLESEDARICLKKGETWVKTDTVTLRGNTLVFPEALYHLLEEEGMRPQGTPDSFTVIGKDGVTYGPFEKNEFVYFNTLRSMLGCDVQGEWNVPD